MSVAGHDLRGPLRILKDSPTRSRTNAGRSLNEEGRAFLKEILKASDRMDGLIDGLLTLSRAGRAEISCESLDLGTLVELVHYELRHGTGRSRRGLRVRAGIYAWGDVRLMMTILRTLIGNAWKYTSRRRGRRALHTESATATLVCVTDNGAGFDMGQADRLFQPFTRLHRQDEFAGTASALRRFTHRETARRAYRSRGRGRAGCHGAFLAAAA